MRDQRSLAQRAPFRLATALPLAAALPLATALLTCFGPRAAAQPAPSVYQWTWNPADALVRIEAQVFVDESTCSNICYDNALNPPWPDPACTPPAPPPINWPWSVLPPVPPPAPPVPPPTPPFDWDEYPPGPPGFELGTIFVGPYCPSPTSDASGNGPPPPPAACGLDWFQRTALAAPTGLVFQNMLSHPSLVPEAQATNRVFASDGDVPWATVACVNAPFVPPAVEVTGMADQVITVRGRRGLIGTVGHSGARSWEVRFNNVVDAYGVLPPGADRYVAEGAATIVMQIPLEISGLTPGVPARTTFEFQTLGEAYSGKEPHPYLDQNFNAFSRPDSDNAYAVATVDTYLNGVWNTQFIEYAGDPPGVASPGPVSGALGGATFLLNPTQSTYPIVLRMTSRCRAYLEDDPNASGDWAFASMRGSVILTVYGPPVVGAFEKVAAGGPGPAYDFWMSRYEITNVEYCDFLNDAEEDLANGGSERSSFMNFDPATGSVTTSAGVVLFEPILSPVPGGGAIQKIRYRPFLAPGTRYAVDVGAESDPVTGVSWVGALKYCNWLTIHAGHAPAERCYAEGNDLADWHPVTISAADWATRDLNDSERDDLVANYRGFRLPMDNLGAALGFRSNQVNDFNEWYKASAYDPTAPNVTRVGPGGEQVPPLHRFFGFGRDAIGGADANFVTSGDPFDDAAAQAGFFDGLNALVDGTSTNDTSNPYGFFDLAGNVAEWGQDRGPGYVLGPATLPGQITRTGSWQQSDVLLAASLREQAGPTLTEATIGFRVLTTFPPPSPCPGDVDGDGRVDLVDLARVLAGFGAGAGDPPYDPAADLDQNGTVDLGDLAQVLAAFGTRC